MLRLGYPNENLTLAKSGITYAENPEIGAIREMERARKGSGIRALVAQFSDNLDTLHEIIIWNAENGIFLYRMPENLAPHLAATELLPPDERMNSRALAYTFGPALLAKLKKIGALARKLGVRLTFHPDLRVILNSPSKYVVMKSARDLFGHATVMDKMGLGPDSILVVHGGGTYGNKAAAMQRWITNFEGLPAAVKRRLVIENDEISYSADDALTIARAVKIPVLLDLFHYSCYNKKGADDQSPLVELLPKIVRTWAGRRLKMHLSEQRPGAMFGAHSDYVRVIPPVILKMVKSGQDLDLMIEARKRELAVRFLQKKYSD